MEPPPDPLISYHTFLSYRSDDSEAAGSLTHSLQKLGLRAWWDKDPGDHDQAPRFQGDVRGKPIPGDDNAVESELESAIARSIMATVVTSPHTLQSVWMRREIEIARRLRTPLYFWHMVPPEGAEYVSVRHRGTTPTEPLPADMFAEAVAQHYEQELLASSTSVTFMQQVSAQGELNVIGHKITTLADVATICSELNMIIELGEFVLHNGEALNTDSVQRFWPEYSRLCERAEDLRRTFQDRFGRRFNVSRTPVSEAFRLKRPFVLKRIRHFEELLENEAFRAGEFQRLDKVVHGRSSDQ